MSAFTLSTSVLRPRASVGLSSRRRRTRSAVRAAGRESSDSFEAFDTSEIEALLASTTEAREEIEGGLEDECGYLADFSADLRLQVEELAAIIELTQGYSVEDLLLEDGDELKDDLNAELVEAQNNIVVLRESVQHLYHVVETTLVRETRSSPRESRPVTTTRVSNDDPDRAARSTRDPRLTVRHAPPPLDPIGRAFRFSSHAVAARPSSIRRMPTAPTRRRSRRRANCSRKSRACSPREEPEVDGEDRGERRKGLPKCDINIRVFFHVSSKSADSQNIEYPTTNRGPHAHTLTRARLPQHALERHPLHPLRHVCHRLLRLHRARRLCLQGVRSFARASSRIVTNRHECRARVQRSVDQKSPAS